MVNVWARGHGSKSHRNHSGSRGGRWVKRKVRTFPPPVAITSPTNHRKKNKYRTQKRDECNILLHLLGLRRCSVEHQQPNTGKSKPSYTHLFQDTDRIKRPFGGDLSFKLGVDVLLALQEAFELIAGQADLFFTHMESRSVRYSHWRTGSSSSVTRRQARAGGQVLVIRYVLFVLRASDFQLTFLRCSVVCCRLCYLVGSRDRTVCMRPIPTNFTSGESHANRILAISACVSRFLCS